jgi:N-acetylglutamate synthase-like GNAT family acetyltransferase
MITSGGQGERRPRQASVTIRSAELTDAPRIAALLTELGYPAGADAVRERLAYWLADQASKVLVADLDGGVAGCISLHAIPYLERTGRWLRIESLVVEAGRRRGGAGRALVDAAEQLARQWGCVLIEVTSKRSRADAHAFYRRLGFTDVCDHAGRFTKEI